MISARSPRALTSKTAGRCAAGMLAAALALTGCGKTADPKAAAPRDNAVPVTVATVRTAEIDRALDVVGSLIPFHDATVASQVEGQVEKTLVDFGERVQAGQELALVDTASYQANARVAEANVAKATASLENARKSLERIRSLERSQISPASDLDTAVAQEAQAAAELKAAEAARAIAELNLSRSRVRAPFTGGVAERVANAGDYVKAGTALFRLVDDTSLKYVFQVPERYAGQVRPGQEVTFRVDAFPGERFRGEVFLVSPAVNASTRSFNVAARVPNEKGRLKANTFATGELVLERNVPSPVVPLDAIVNFAGVTKVFLIETNTAWLREVRVGRVRAGVQEIVDGVQEGQTLATSGTTRLYDGAKVRIKTEPAPATTAQN